MRPPGLQDLTLLPEDRAVQRWFDGRNWRLLVPFLWGSVVASAVLAMVSAAHGRPAVAIAGAVDAAALVALWALRRRAWFAEQLRGLTVGVVLVQFGLDAVLAVPELRLALSFGLFPLLLLFLHLRPAESTLLAAAFGASGVATALAGTQPAGPALLAGQLIGLSLPPLVALAAALALNRRRRRLFLSRWREQVTRERERTRMRDELADARKIQLAMLPEGPPVSDWLDLAALSLPASEVGGDFYDYLELPGGRLAVAVGDVAGHGVASGLVLAAVKSGLHLLGDELLDPVPVFQRLDRMVREAVRWRVFVTLLVAIFEPREGRLRVVTAGHPPALHRGAGGATRWLGHGAPPLGTHLPARYRESSAPLGAGDLVLLYTDGVTELADLAGEPFGQDRLQRTAERLERTRGGSARALREELLDALSHHKGDAPQLDDITLVVGRIGRSADPGTPVATT